jgi:hypothetical protein
MIVRSASALALCAAASAANASFISFASDTSPLNPTLIASWDNSNQVTHVADFGPTIVDMLFDADEAGPQSPVTVPAALHLDLTMSYASSAPLGFGMFAHAFNVLGTFEFTNLVGNDEFTVKATVSLGEAIFVGLGTGTTVMSASITGAEMMYDQVAFDPAIVAFGALNCPGDFGFTITALNGGAGAQLITNGSGQVIGISGFQAESSFSGSFANIPTPGAAALAGLAGMTAIRRRRK